MGENIQPAASIVVGMSGGVDSAVTAWLLKQQNASVMGIFMQNWEDDNTDAYCSIKQDLLDVVAVADLIGLEVDAVNFAQEYKERVFSYFLSEYTAGRTPNPDVLCNAEIKFKAFLAHALQLGATKIATGHYAKCVEKDGLFYLHKARDSSKDQSYFLYRLNQYQLAHALFPLGDWLKSDVRIAAAQAGLPNHAKKDSTGICFIGERPFREFLNRYLPRQAGFMRNPEGKVVGEHMGLSYYTIGQRQGLGIGGAGEPWFVAGKDMPTNTLIVVQGHDHPLLFSQELFAEQLSWTLDTPPALGHYTAKTRYRQADAPCELLSCENGRIQLRFSSPQWAVTPGQSVVLYDGDICLGGGVIV